MVTYDDNIIDRLTTSVEGDTLVIDLEGNFNLSGNSDRVVAVEMSDLMNLGSSGAADVALVGSTDSYNLDISGASFVDATDLGATEIELDISGASTVDVHASGTVTGSVSGGSSLFVHGQPQSVLVDTSGASNVYLRD